MSYSLCLLQVSVERLLEFISLESEHEEDSDKHIREKDFHPKSNIDYSSTNISADMWSSSGSLLIVNDAAAGDDSAVREPLISTKVKVRSLSSYSVDYIEAALSSAAELKLSGVGMSYRPTTTLHSSSDKCDIVCDNMRNSHPTDIESNIGRVANQINSSDALRNVNVHINAGDRVCVIGRSGSGKSSMIRLLLRLNDYHSGSIRFNGVELRSMSKTLLRKRIAVIPQSPLV
jgi:ABC-type multidrug transport system fused ATPase/permease subunit